ncbi:MAG: hypothetical protein ABI999_16300 [Acidobacteriota bacterium]
MLTFQRPAKPANFDSAVQSHQLELAAFFAAEEIERKPKFMAKWTDFKNALVIAQNYKCGYCEVSIVGQYGDVEHFFPKGEVWELIAGEEGLEQNDLVKVKGRNHTTLSERGYWWRAKCPPGNDPD